MPNTQVYNLLDNQMTLVVRAWGSQEYNQKLIDEVSHYLSSAQADLDVTSPFDFKENLSSLANKTRIALLLSQDYFYKVENKNEFTVGFEVIVFFKVKTELAWSSVGRFGLKTINNNETYTLFELGTSLDNETLLPVELLGVESDVEINSGSLKLNTGTQILLSSVYGGSIDIDLEHTEKLNLKPSNSEVSYWYSLINVD
jgi:hypothetical protein